MNLPQVYMCSPSWTLSLLPPHTIPLGHPSAPAPSIQYRGSNLDFHRVIAKVAQSFCLLNSQFLQLLTSCNSMAHFPQLVIQFWYIIIKVPTLFILPLFFTDVSFLFHDISPRIPHYIQMPHLFRLLWLVITFQTSLVFDDNFKDYWSCILCDGFHNFLIFLITRLEWHIFGWTTSEIKCLSHHILSKV